MGEFIVALDVHKGVTYCWLADWAGDPGRTCVKKNARVYKTLKGAQISLGKARKYRPFESAEIQRLK